MFNRGVEQGNALSTEWNFGDGESETVGTDEFQVTKVTHTFTQPGEHTIIYTIHTDDLQTPGNCHGETPGRRRRNQRSRDDHLPAGCADSGRREHRGVHGFSVGDTGADGAVGGVD